MFLSVCSFSYCDSVVVSGGSGSKRQAPEGGLNGELREGSRFDVRKEFADLARFEECANDLFLNDDEFEECFLVNRVVRKVFPMRDATEIEVIGPFCDLFEFDEETVDV